MAKKFLAKIVAAAMVIATLAGFGTVSAAGETNVALGKTAYHATTANYSAGNAALTNGSTDDFVYQAAYEGYTDLSRVLVVDLGEDYAEYDISSIEVVTPNPAGAGSWSAGWFANTYKVWLADSLPGDHVRDDTLAAIGAVLIGSQTATTGATEQNFLTFDNTDAVNKRYVVVGHEYGWGGGICVSEIRVMATERVGENIALGKTGIVGGEVLTDGNIENYAYADVWYDNAGITQFFTVDLGEDYADYDINSIDVVTIAPSTAMTYIGNTAFMNVSYKAWLADRPSHSAYGDKADASLESDMGAVLIGKSEVLTDADTTQQTVSFSNRLNRVSKRYVVVGREFGTGTFGVAEVRVWATRKAPATYTITTAIDANVVADVEVDGAAYVAGTEYEEGAEVTVTAKPMAGYEITTATADASMAFNAMGGTYTFTLAADTTITLAATEVAADAAATIGAVYAEPTIGLTTAFAKAGNTDEEYGVILTKWEGSAWADVVIPDGVCDAGTGPKFPATSPAHETSKYFGIRFHNLAAGKYRAAAYTGSVIADAVEFTVE